MICSALTDDVRAAVALRHLHESERASGNAAVYGMQLRTGVNSWSEWWAKKAREHVAEALAILPPCDSYDHPAPAYVGDKTCPLCATWIAANGPCNACGRRFPPVTT